jgi:hypothetical protein
MNKRRDAAPPQKERAMEADERHMLRQIALKARALLDRLDTLTTEEFQRGGEHVEREALRTALGEREPCTCDRCAPEPRVDGLTYAQVQSIIDALGCEVERYTRKRETSRREHTRNHWEKQRAEAQRWLDANQVRLTQFAVPPEP